MLKLDFHPTGRHFLQIPGPSPVPDRILRAMSLPTIDHRGPEFGALGRRCCRASARFSRRAIRSSIYPSSGTGAWEAALANTMSPGDHGADVRDRALRDAVAEDGGAPRARGRVPRVAGQRRASAARAELAPRRAGRPDRGAPARATPSSASRRCAWCTTKPRPASPPTSPSVRRAIDAAKHPALLMVDTISGLASADYRHDEWGVDVTISGSQKGLMLPPGISFNALSPRALEAAKAAQAAALVLGLGRDRRDEQGRLLAVHAEHQPAVWLVRVARHAARRRARRRVRAPPALGAKACAPRCDAWGLPIQCADASVYSPVLTGVITPAGVDADAVRQLIHERFDLSLGTGPRQAEGPHVPHRPPGRQQRPHAAGDASRCRDGAAACGREARRQRRAGGDGALRQACRTGDGEAGGVISEQSPPGRP